MQATPNILSTHYKIVDFLNRIADMLLLGLALGFAHLQFNKGWGQTSTLLFLCAIVYFQLSAALSDIYGSQRSIKIQQHIYQVSIALGGTFMLIAMSTGLSNRLHYLADRKFLLVWLATSMLFFATWRIFIRRTLALFRQHGINQRSAAIVGIGELGQSLALRFRNSPWMGIDVQAFYDNGADEKFIGDTPIIGNIEQLIADAKSNRFDRIYITLPMSSQHLISQLIDELSDSTSNVFLIPDVFVFDLLNARQTSIDGLPAISIYDSPFSLADSVIKRGFDIFGSIAILSLIAWPMMLIAAAVKLTSSGPVIFKQIRYGLDGKAIEVWKFRSMSTMDNGSVVKQATKNDCRITPLGAFLRRTSLDELPQFINVLQGHMSIVGPRPHAVAHNEEYRKLIKGYMLRHKVKPGITGWAQINGWRGETDTLDKMEKRVEYDLDYIRNWTVWLDVKIVLLTIFKGFTNKNAY